MQLYLNCADVSATLRGREQFLAVALAARRTLLLTPLGTARRATYPRFVKRMQSHLH
jgi:hypothetical protein